MRKHSDKVWREAIARRLVFRQPYGQIAAALGIPEGTVRSWCAWRERKAARQS